MGRALLIVDMQEVLIPVVWRGEELAARIAALARRARDREIAVIALQQTGPPGMPFDPDEPGWQLSRRLGLERATCGSAKLPCPGRDRQPARGLTPAQIVDHHNWVLSHAIHPGGRLHLAAADVFG